MFGIVIREYTFKLDTDKIVYISCDRVNLHFMKKWYFFKSDPEMNQIELLADISAIRLKNTNTLDV